MAHATTGNSTCFRHQYILALCASEFMSFALRILVRITPATALAVCFCVLSCRRVIAEQHLHIVNTRPGYIGSIATALDVADAVEFAGQRAVQVRQWS